MVQVGSLLLPIAYRSMFMGPVSSFLSNGQRRCECSLGFLWLALDALVASGCAALRHSIRTPHTLAPCIVFRL